MNCILALAGKHTWYLVPTFLSLFRNKTWWCWLHVHVHDVCFLCQGLQNSSNCDEVPRWQRYPTMLSWSPLDMADAAFSQCCFVNSQRPTTFRSCKNMQKHHISITFRHRPFLRSPETTLNQGSWKNQAAATGTTAVPDSQAWEDGSPRARIGIGWYMLKMVQHMGPIWPDIFWNVQQRVAIDP